MSAPNEKNKPVNKKLEQILENLHNPSKITNSLDALQVYGNSSIIKPLFEFLLTSGNAKSNAEVVEFLSNLKDSPSIASVMDCLHDQKLKPVQKEILSTIWNSPLDYSEFLHEFVKIAVEDDFLSTLECLTIIETLEGPFSEKSILESQLILSEYLEGKHSKSAEKDQLISEIALLIKDFDRDLQDFD